MQRVIDGEMISIDCRSRSIDTSHRAKRIIDVVGSSLLLVFLAPLLLAAAVAIKLDTRGPVLFRQRRHGCRQPVFEILKFRTMSLTACDPSGVTQTRPNDQRVTRVGRFLRRTNIDELPQLINVLKGDMSLVGPRPHVPSMRAGGMLYEHLVPDYFERLKMRPGMTGLAQICGYRGSTTDPRLARERVACDIAYIRHWSLWLDIRILWATARTEIFRGTGI